MKSKRIMKSIALVMAAAVVSLTAGSVITEAATTNVEKTTQIANRADVKYGKIKKADKAMLKEMFDADYYAQLNPDVVEKYGNDADALFNHFVECGVFEGRTPSADFNVSAYASAYPDLQKKFGGDVVKYYKHYQSAGKAEGRNLTTVASCAKAGVNVYAMNSITSTGVVAEAAPIMTPATYNQVVAAVENAGLSANVADNIVAVISSMPAIPDGVGSSGGCGGASGPTLSSYSINIISSAGDNFQIQITTNYTGDLQANKVVVTAMNVGNGSTTQIGQLTGDAVTCGGETLTITLAGEGIVDASAVPISVVVSNDNVVLGAQAGILNPVIP